MKKLALVLAVLVAPMFSHAAANPSAPFVAGGNLTYYGATAYHVDSSTPTATPVSLFTGSGYLFSIACSSGASGDFGVAFDSATGSGLTTATQGKAVSPHVLASADGVTTCTAKVCGFWDPNFGSVRIVNGLAFTKSGTYPSCVIYALSDAEILSGAH